MHECQVASFQSGSNLEFVLLYLCSIIETPNQLDFTQHLIVSYVQTQSLLPSTKIQLRKFFLK